MSTCLNQNNSETPCAFSEWTDEEQAFRRGFVHGIMAAANRYRNARCYIRWTYQEARPLALGPMVFLYHGL